MKSFCNYIKKILGIRSWALSCLCAYVMCFLYCTNDIISYCIIQGSLELDVEKPEPTFIYHIVSNAYNLLVANPVLNELTLLVLVFVTGLFLYHVVKDNHKSSFYTLCILAYLLPTFIAHPLWQYVSTPIFSITYDVLFVAIIGLSLLVLIGVNIYKAFVPSKVQIPANANTSGFSVNDETNHQDLGWTAYCDTLLSKVDTTDLSHEAFTIGITGKWGSGKTTFLEELQKQLDARSYIVVRFNPWNCHSSQQVITSFFGTLVTALGAKKDYIGEALVEYGDLLAGLDIHPLLSKFLTKKEKDANELKTQLTTQLPLCGRKIAILIDDIDRLDQDEVYETLKLIRETANFPNLVYFVAYDIRHVVNMLSEKGINNGEEYVRKIFQMEIPLPGYENYVLPLVLYKELKNHLIDPDALHWIKFVSTCTTLQGEYTITKYLKNFRDVKRFANSFIINYTHIAKTLNKSEYSVLDLFWLELLHYSDLQTYNKLQNCPLTFLSSHTMEKGPVYSLLNEYSHSGAYVTGTKKHKDDNEESPLAKNIEPSVPYRISEETATLLSMLFNSTRQDDSSIRYLENFQRYFAYRLPNNRISTDVFRNVIINSNTTEAIEPHIIEWLSGFSSKRQSLIRQMEQFEVTNQNLQVCKNYLYVMLYLLRTAHPGSMDSFCLTCLKIQKYPISLRNEISSWFFDQLMTMLPTIQYPWTWTYVCKKLYPTSTYRIDEDGNEIQYSEPETLLNSDQLKHLSSINFKHYMAWAGNPSIVDIAKRHTNLNTFVKESIVETSYDPDSETAWYKNIIYDDLLAHYGSSSSTQFDEFIKPLTPDNECGYYTEELEQIKESIYNIFNSYEGFKTFVNTCFKESEKNENYYKSIGI